MDEVSLTDFEAMELALEEARKGLGFVSPNPPVGCVVLNARGHLISQGYHKKYGGPHAEVNALQGLTADQLRGGRVFVTLEPCAHEGKTPSCAQMMAKLPIHEVIYGLLDPNPLVSGEGANILKAAGIRVTEYQGSLKEQLEEVCEHFLVNFREKRPFISLKVASSLDGQMALESGESKWITGEVARKHGHFLRATHAGILIGQKTLEIDNPSLDVRHPDFPGHTNQVVVLLSLQSDKKDQWRHLHRDSLNLMKSHRAEDVHFLLRSQEGYERLSFGENGTLVQDPEPQYFDKNLVPRGARLKDWPSSILIEGGSQVLSSFISEGRAHRLYLFQAPILLGAKASKAWTKGVKIESMSERIALRNPSTHRMGPDILITGRF